MSQDATLAPAPRAPAGDIRAVLDRFIEASWLAAVLLIPILFSPPGWFAFFETPKVAGIRVLAGLIAVLWAGDLALAAWSSQLRTPKHWWASLRGWLAVDRALGGPQDRHVGIRVRARRPVAV
jgi:hypothetical protein